LLEFLQVWLSEICRTVRRDRLIGLASPLFCRKDIPIGSKGVTSQCTISFTRLRPCE
jgi:hypothetical protein